MRNHAKFAGLFFALAALVLLPLAAVAQEPDEGQPEITLRDVKDRLKANQKHLNEARKRGRAGDAPGMDRALENFTRGQEGLDRALSQGRFNGNLAQREEAFDRVEKATRKHGEVLADLRERLPEQAHKGIDRAIEASQKGRQTALDNLSKTREERRAEAAQRRSERAPGQAAGRPDGTGRPGGVGPSGGAGGGPPGGAGGAGGAGRPPAPPAKPPRP